MSEEEKTYFGIPASQLEKPKPIEPLGREASHEIADDLNKLELGPPKAPTLNQAKWLGQRYALNAFKARALLSQGDQADPIELARALAITETLEVVLNQIGYHSLTEIVNKQIQPLKKI